MKYPSFGAIAAVLLAGTAGALAGEPGDEPRFTRAEKFYVTYKLSAHLTTIDTVELWVTRDGGKSWNKSLTDSTGSGKILYRPPEDGSYGFLTVAVDKAGNREKSPQTGTIPAFQVIVDRTPPKVTAQGAGADQLSRPGAVVQVSWKAEDEHLAANPVEIQIKYEGEETWRPLATDLAAEGAKDVTMPAAAAARAHLRVAARDLAGNLGWAAAGSLVFDAAPPEGRILGPKVAKALDVELLYELSDPGFSGLASAAIWITADNGKTWRKLADAPTKATSTKVRLPRPGSYGLALSAVDRAGNVLAPPEPGKPPAFTLLTDTDAPRLKLLEPVEAQAFSLNVPVSIAWTAEDENLGEKPISLEFSSDGGETWTVIAKDLANTGKYQWKPPALDSNKCLVRIRAQDLAGNASQAISRPFTVDNTPPASQAGFAPVEEDDGKKR
jgi:hypothetical protein